MGHSRLMFFKVSQCSQKKLQKFFTVV